MAMSLKIMIAVIGGILIGSFFGNGELARFADAGKLIIHWVKLIAGPFLFLTIVASIVEVQVSLSHGFRVIGIALVNTAIAIVIGMALAHEFLADVRIENLQLNLNGAKATEFQLSFSHWLKTLMPTSLFSPFVENDTLLIALLAFIFGLALRSVNLAGGEARLKRVAEICEEVRKLPALLLEWVIELTPFAVLAVMAGTVSQHGLGIFTSLLRYVAVVIIGFLFQIIFVYGFWVFVVARVRPKDFWQEAKSPMLYSFGVNSSLATLPLTLKALKNLGVSARSASLGAGVATNLNNDGIVLYEAMAVFFVAQLSHITFTLPQMAAAAVACIVASMGITGVPEAGFISLSVVISTLGLPAEALPLLLAVDWLIARLRSVVNVVSDMTLAISLDATER